MLLIRQELRVRTLESFCSAPMRIIMAAFCTVAVMRMTRTCLSAGRCREFRLNA